MGAVSYLNTKPLVYGIREGMMEDRLDLQIDHPAAIARMLKENSIDLGLIPIAAINDLPEHYIISDYCIGCDGEVGSVCLFSEVPLEQVETVLLDYQSRTSAELLKILLKDHWKIHPEIITSNGEYRHQIMGKTAGLVIGDRAFEQRAISKFRYDLGYEWKKFTGLPFVFACWVANREIDKNYFNLFSEALKFGLDNRSLLFETLSNKNYNVRKYLTDNIRYLLDDDKRQGMQTFFSLVKQL